MSRQQMAVAATCLVAAVTYAGSVTMSALLLYVLPGVVIGALVGSRFAGHRPGAAVIVGGIIVLAWSELANVLTGTANGPAARSTFVAAVCGLFAVVLASSRWSALFLVPVTGSVFGALALGAGGEVRLVAVVTAVCAVGTLGWIERSKLNWTVQPRNGLALVVLSLGVGVAATAAVVLQGRNDSRQPVVLARAEADPSIKPPWVDPLARFATPRVHHRSTHFLPARRRVHPNTHAKAAALTGQPVSTRSTGSHSRVWLAALAAIVALALALVLAAIWRLVAVRLAWRRLRRRLASGTAADQISGAWLWARMRLEARRVSLPANLSPDVLAAGGAPDDLPRDVSVQLRVLATVTAAAAFSPQPPATSREAAASWRTAGRAEMSACESLSRRAKVALALRAPRATIR